MTEIDLMLVIGLVFVVGGIFAKKWQISIFGVAFWTFTLLWNYV